MGPNDAGKYTFLARTENNAWDAANIISSTANVQLNVWKHMLVTYDQEGTTRIYIDGVLDTTSNLVS